MSFPLLKTNVGFPLPKHLTAFPEGGAPWRSSRGAGFALPRGWRPGVALVRSGPRGGSPRFPGGPPSGRFVPGILPHCLTTVPCSLCNPSHLSASTQALSSAQLSLLNRMTSHSSFKTRFKCRFLWNLPQQPQARRGLFLGMPTRFLLLRPGQHYSGAKTRMHVLRKEKICIKVVMCSIYTYPKR